MFLMKIIFIGMNRENSNTFFEMLRTNLEYAHEFNSYQNSIGVDICVKNLFDEFNKQIAKLILWNISPEPFFRWVRPLFYNGSIGAIILHSDNSENGIKKTKSIINEFDKLKFPKYLIILDNSHTEAENNRINELINFAHNSNFNVEIFENHQNYNVATLPPNNEGRQISTNSKIKIIKRSYLNELRLFCETIIIDLFGSAVKNTPGNTFNIKAFKENYFKNLKKFEKNIEKMYNLLDSLGFEHDDTYIFIKHSLGLFTVNIFNATCYFHFPNSKLKKYICMVPEQKDFQGWSNLKFISSNFFLSIAKAYYLMEGKYDSVVQRQLNEIKKVLKQQKKKRNNIF
ncbi:MAG: hypothetical protein ACTSRZ_09325 [Promethearchaeota archaeon]